MRVAIDATALGSTRGGDETYMRGLLHSLAEVTPDGGADSFPVFLKPEVDPPPSLVGRSAFPVRRVPSGSAPMRYVFTLPRLLLAEPEPSQVLYSMIHAPPVSPVPRALYLPDVSFRRHPEFYRLSTRLRLNLLVPIHLRQARVIMTISEFSRRDILDLYGLPPDRVFVVPHAIEQVWDAPSRARAGSRRDSGLDRGWLASRGITAPYFVYVGNLHPRKNVPRLIEAFVRARAGAPALASHQLVIAGGRWWGTADESAARAAPPGSVVALGRVSAEERDRLLGAAVALAYPSLFEGFGLPPVEAMAVGTPVLASNTSAMPEVLGDAALLVDPLDVEALAQGLVRLGTDAGLRAALTERGLERAARYSRRATAGRALEAFRYAIQGARP